MKDTDEYDTGRDHGHAVQGVLGTGVDYAKKGWTATLDGIGSAASWLWDSKAGKYVRGTTRGMVDGTAVGRGLDKAEEAAEIVKKRQAELRDEYLGEDGTLNLDENGRIVSKATAEEEPAAEPAADVKTDKTPAVATKETPETDNNEIVEERHTLGDGPAGPSHKVEYVLKDGSVVEESERGDAIQIAWRRPDGTMGKEFIDADKVAMIRAFVSNKWDAVNGFKLKVVEDTGDALSSLYYEPHEVVGADYQRRGDGAKRRLNFANTEFTLSNSKFKAAVIRIYELDKKQGRVDPALHALALSFGYKGASDEVVQKMIRGADVPPTNFTPHTPHTDGLKVNFVIPGTNTNSMVVLSAEQVAAVRSFLQLKRDVNGGYKLMVNANSGEPFSPLYYQMNTQGNALVRRGENPSSVAVASSVSTFKLNETQFHAAVMGIMKADADRGYVDPALKQWADVMLPQSPVQPVNGGQNVQPGINQGGQLGITQGGPNGGQQGGPKGGQQGGLAPVGGATTPSDDDKNFFLSAGSWVNNAFSSLGNMIPIPLLTKFIQMIGNCIGGLLKTIGYVLEGEWGKAGNELFGWIKDAAIVGGVAYGAYFLKNKISEYFKSDNGNSSSSSSSSGSTNSSSSSTNTSTNTNTDLSDLLAGILNNATGSGSTNDDKKEDEDKKKDEDVYIGLNHSSNGQVAGTVTTYTDASGTTQRLLDTSDRFLLAGDIRDPNSDGTLWRVKVDKTK